MVVINNKCTCLSYIIICSIVFVNSQIHETYRIELLTRLLTGDKSLFFILFFSNNTVKLTS